MNTSITATEVTADSIVSLIGTYDEIETNNVQKITGNKDDITTIISSTKIHGYHAADFVLTEVIDTETFNIFNACTSGIVINKT